MPVSVAVPPTQIAPLEEAVTVGGGPTVTVTVCVLVHPCALVPVTVYVVVAAGETVTVVPVNDPGIHEYVEAPVPVSVVLPPAQIEGLAAVAVMVGAGFTVTTDVPVRVHPLVEVLVRT